MLIGESSVYLLRSRFNAFRIEKNEKIINLWKLLSQSIEKNKLKGDLISTCLLLLKCKC